jgi:MoaA/NifB/PqqE/SkfB family radical SAM enzyme
MQIRLFKRTCIDCTSDPVDMPWNGFKDAISATMAIIDSSLVLEFDHLSCEIDGFTRRTYNRDDSIAYLNSLKGKEPAKYSIKAYVDKWYFGQGGNCSDWIEVSNDSFVVSCQDWYDEDVREEFHDRVSDFVSSLGYSAVKQGELKAVHIEATRRCDRSCKTCYKQKDSVQLSPKLFSKIPKARAYSIGGGEPLIYPYIQDLISTLKERDKDVFTQITTNGTSVREFNPSPDMFTVSMDGIDQQEHEITHDTKLEDCEKALSYYRSRMKRIAINHIIHRKNIGNTLKFARKYVKEFNCQINLILFKGHDEMKPRPEQLAKLLDDIDKNKNLGFVMDSCLSEILTKISGGYHFSNCMMGHNSKAFSADGRLTICSHGDRLAPDCSVIQDYERFFLTLRPLVIAYSNDGQDGAHRLIYRHFGKEKEMKVPITHNIPESGILGNRCIYILKYEEQEKLRKDNTFYLVLPENGYIDTIYFGGKAK